MFHRVHFISAATATIAVLILLLTVLSPSPSLYGVAYAQANSGPTFDDDAPTTRKVEETPWYRTTDYPPFMENNNRDAGAPVEATDTDSGDTLTYSLDGTDAVYFKIDESSGQIRTKEPLDYENDPAEYTVTVSVHDGKDSSGGPDETIDATITVTITLTNVNEPPKPTREEGEPQPDYDGDMEFTILENTIGPMVFFLKDPEGRGEGWLISGLASDIDSNLFDYEEDVGPTNEQQILFKEKPDYENPEDANKDNVYTFTIMLYDTYRGENGKVAQTFPNIKVRVTDVEESNENPEFAEEDTTRSIAENAAPGASVGDPVAADDLDNDTLTYTLGGDDAASFDIDASSGQLETKDALDYETKSSYTITVSVSDGKNLENSADDEIDDKITVTISVTDVNDPPQFADSATTELNVVENTEAGQPVGDPVAATDEESDTLTYALDEGDGASFEIDATGQIKTKDALDYETKSSYTVTVSVHDGMEEAGNAENPPVEDATIDVTITVTDVNEGPTFADSAPDTQTVAENTAAGTDIGGAYTATDPEGDTPLTYSLGGTDAASFAIDDSTGQLKTKVGLNYETKSSYTVDVQVTDGVDADGNTDTTVDDTHTVTITVTNVDENGSITFSSDPPTIGTALTATVADPDGGVTGETWEWEISDDQSTWNPITGADTNTYTPIAGDLNKYLRATAQYTDAEGSDKTAQEEAGAVADATHTNSRPEFAAQEDTRSVAENTAAGQNIGEPVAAPDDGVGTLVYSLGGTDAASFDIDTSTGQLETKGDLDHETKDTYTVTVSVTDGLDEYSKADTAADDDNIEVTINVTDVNEGPTFADDAPATQTVAENTTADTDIGSAYTATDPESDTPLTYSLGGTDAASFAIGETNGQLKTKADLDHEGKETYSVTIQVSDGKDADDNTENTATIDDRHDVTITVTDEDDPGTITFSSDSPSAGTTLTATLDDDDGVKTTPAVTWLWESSPNGTDTWTTITGETTNSYTPGTDDVGKYLRVTASYDDDEGSGKTAQKVSQAVLNAPPTNQNPSFRGNAATTLSVAENTPAGVNIGDPYTATQTDSKGTLVYSLGGTDASSFNIDTATGQLKTKTVFNFEAPPTSYTVTVSVSDEMDDYSNADTVIDATITVTIEVTNIDEPGVPGEPTVTAADGTAAKLNVIWTAVPATVTAPVDGYDVRYKVKDVQDPKDWNTDIISVTSNSATITGLEYEKTYEVQVRSKNSEGHSDWSDTGEGSIPKLLNVSFSQASQTVTEGSGATITVSVSPAADRALSIPISATSSNAESGDYSPTSTTVSISSGSDSGTFTISTTSDSDQDDETVNMAFGTLPAAVGTGPNSTATLTIDDTTPSGTNQDPSFADATITRSVAENTEAGENIGEPVAATDPDSVGTLVYSLDATGAQSFDIDGTSGQLKTKTGVDLDYETQQSYTVTVSVTDGMNPYSNADPAEDGAITVTINVTDIEVSGAPDRPAVNPTPGAAAGLTVTWTAVTATETAPVDGYDVQYREKDTTDTDPWLTTNVTVSGASATITGLAHSTTYEVQVRSKNSEGESGWSPTGEGSTRRC